MATPDLPALVRQVRAIRCAPQTAQPLTPDHALNRALADLAQYDGSTRPALVSLLPFWLAIDHDADSLKCG